MNKIYWKNSCMKNKNSFEWVYEIVKQIPKGKVMTYKSVSIMANVATPRIVGFALHVNPDSKNIPCHRVIFSDGSLSKGFAFGGEEAQKQLLEKEGICFTKQGKVILEKYLHPLI